jgi:hypothetical protein
MSIQSVRRAKRYLRSLEEEFVNSDSIARTAKRSEKGAFDVHLYFSCVNHMRGVSYEMAKLKNDKEPSRVEFKGYVNYVLTQADKEGFKQWDVEDHDLWLLLAGDIQNGYKLGCSFNPQNDTFQVTYMCNDPASTNAGYILSAYAKDWYIAVKSLVYKHNEVFAGEWPLDGKTLGDSWG